MCDQCEREVSQMAAEVFQDLEAAVIVEEAKAGLSWSGASRAMTQIEQRSRVQFGAIDDLHAQSTGTVARALVDLERATVAALLAVLARMRDGTVAAVVQRVTELASPISDSALPMGREVGTAIQAIVAALAEARISAGHQLITEARNQGVPTPLLAAATRATRKVTVAERKQLEAQAHSLAVGAVARVLTTATSKGLRAVDTVRTGATATEVVDTVGSALQGLKPAGLEDLARQTTTAAINTGRRAVLEAAPAPEKLQASELLDRSTCGPCSHIDGTTYETLEDALADYPSGGSFAGCLGEGRCRGTLVAVWATEAAPTFTATHFSFVNSGP